MVRLICVAPGCDEIAEAGCKRCGRHEREAEERRRAAGERAKQSDEVKARSRLYKTARWKKEARRFLNAHPICEDCGELGVVEPSREVDHKARHMGDPKKFWDRSNWQALCKRCHSRKTAREVFGHEPQ